MDWRESIIFNFAISHLLLSRGGGSVGLLEAFTLLHLKKLVLVLLLRADDFGWVDQRVVEVPFEGRNGCDIFFACI